MADANLFQASAHGDIRSIVYDYAAQWRHGLTGFWPVYVPGFFAAAIAIWVWSIGRPLRRLLPELLLLTGAAAAFALVLAPEATRPALHDLHSELGITPGADILTVDAYGLALGVYSLLAWNAVILACHRALWWRSFWPLVVTAAMDVLLFFVRPYTFDDLVSTWLQRASNGDLRAVLCLFAVPLLSTGLVVIHLLWEKREHSAVMLPKPFQLASCLLFGHKVDNRELASPSRSGEVPLRCRISLGRRRVHSCRPHTGLFLRRTSLQVRRRTKSAPRICLHSLRASSVTDSGNRSSTTAGCIQEGGSPLVWRART